MKKCERCNNQLSKNQASERRPIPVTYGNTDITICYKCAVELTSLIGYWLGTEPMEDPVAWFIEMADRKPRLTVSVTYPEVVDMRSLSTYDMGDFEVDVNCAKCGNLMTLNQPHGHSEYVPSGTCENCGQLNLLVFDFGSMKWEHLTEKPPSNLPNET